MALAGCLTTDCQLIDITFGSPNAPGDPREQALITDRLVCGDQGHLETFLTGAEVGRRPWLCLPSKSLLSVSQLSRLILSSLLCSVNMMCAFGVLNF